MLGIVVGLESIIAQEKKEHLWNLDESERNKQSNKMADCLHRLRMFWKGLGKHTHQLLQIENFNIGEILKLHFSSSLSIEYMAITRI